MKLLYSYSLLALILLITACGGSDTEKQADSSMPANLSEGSDLPEDRLYFDVDTTALLDISVGDTLTAALQSGEQYDMVVFRAEETIPGLLAIAANVDGDMEVGQANLIYRNNELRGSVDMHRMGLKYQVYYDSEKKQHYLLPRTNEDILEGSEPLTAPEDKVEQD